jgi:hypothetical protein
MAAQAAGPRPNEPQKTIVTNSASVKDKTLNFDELDRVAGGIIIVSGLPLLSQRFTSALDRVALNPQPLPPRILFGH